MRTQQSRFQIHSENPYASGQGQRPRGPRAEIDNAALDVSYSRPLVNVKTNAVQYYFNCHLRTFKDIPGIVKTVPDDFTSLWESLGDSPMLELAVSSMALATFSRTQQHPPAAKEASFQYQRLLRMAHVALSSLDERNIEICLLANFFMSRYEDVIYCSSPSHQSRTDRKASFTSTLHSLAHHDGALAILKIWKDRLNYTQPATNIIKFTRRAMIRSALMRTLTLPEWIADGSFFGEHGIELEYDRLAVRIAKVREQLISLLEGVNDPRASPHNSVSVAEELNNEARDVDIKLEEWASRLPNRWRGYRHSLESFHLSLPSRDFYSSTVYSHSSLAVAAVWCHYYATRMLIISTRLRIIGVCNQDSTDNQRLECESHMITVANSLASTLPFCHGRFKFIPSSKSAENPTSLSLNTDGPIEPYVCRLTAWPLTIASSLQEVDSTLGLWFKLGLTYLGKAVGAGALECAGADGWLEL